MRYTTLHFTKQSGHCILFLCEIKVSIRNRVMYYITHVGLVLRYIMQRNNSGKLIFLLEGLERCIQNLVVNPEVQIPLVRQTYMGR